MGECFIVRRGGGGGIGSSAFAVIAVTYPAGSTCTCTCGSKVLRAKDTSGSYLFLIPEAGTWTVRCTDGTDTASTAKSITKQYQVEKVELSYRYYLLKDGVQNTDAAAGAWTWIGYSNKGSITCANGKMLVQMSMDYGGSENLYTGAAYHKNKVNVANYSKLKCTVTAVSNVGGTSYCPKIGLTSDALSGYADISADPTLAASVNASVGTLSIDISALNGAYYVVVQVPGNDSVTVSNIWLE